MTPIWDQIVDGAYELQLSGRTPQAIILTEEQWEALHSEWRFGFSSGPKREGERRINGICVALADPSYTGPVVLGGFTKTKD